MKYVHAILFCLMLQPCMAGQKNALAKAGIGSGPSNPVVIDSLLRQLPLVKSDTLKVDILNQLALRHQHLDPGKTIEFGEQAMALANQTGFEVGVAQSHLTLGVVGLIKADYPTALEHLQKAIAILAQHPRPEMQCKAHNYMGTVYMKIHDYPNMLDHQYKALRYAEKTGNQVMIAKAIGSVALGQSYTKHFDKAKENFERAISMLQELGNIEDLRPLYQNLALMYNHQHNHKKALETILRLLDLLEKHPEPRSLMLAHANLASSYTSLKQWSKAVEHADKTLEMQQQLGNKEALSNTYGMLGYAYLESLSDTANASLNAKPYNIPKQQRLLQAKEFLLLALELARNQHDLKLTRSAAHQLHQVHELLGDYRASLNFYKESVIARDSLYTAADKKKVATLEAERETELKQKELEIQGLKLQRAETQRYYLAGAAFLFLLLSGSLYNRFRLKTRKNRELQIAYTDLQKLQEELLQKEKSLFAKALLETELKALRAQMNPHFIFNCLNSIQAFILRENRHDATDYLQKFSRLIRLILDNSQKTSTTLEDEKEILTLYLELERLRLKGKFDFEIEIDEDLDAEFTEFPSMVIQPLVENSIWHGLMPSEEHGHLRISFRKEDEHLMCVVEDNGIGIARSQELKGQTGHQSKGLKLIQDRLNAWSLTRELSSHVRVLDTTTYGAGTRTEISIQQVREPEVQYA